VEPQEYGIMGYTHAGGVDRPLVAYKTAGGNSPAVVVPHMNWRGLFSMGTTPSGAASPVAVEWPGFRTTAYHSMGETQAVTKNWMGSLLEEQRDAGGLLYKRNRYYDPKTGQFTQADPIGLGGGLNTYGFAAGDPVTYSDPYGLCAVRGDLGPLAPRVWMMLPPEQPALLTDQRANKLRISESMRESLPTMLWPRLQESFAFRMTEDGSRTIAMQDRLGDCLRACERGGEAINRFCRSIPIKERRVRALCWAVTKGSEPLCRGFYYAREWEGWPW
jgi:RHS repeat-associated protein